MVNTGISVVIPTHPARLRNGMLARALKSVMNQTVQPDVWYVTNDLERLGAAVTRNRGLAQVETEWVAFLDSDDEWLPNHLEVLIDHLSNDVDVLYSGCTIVDPLGRKIPLQEEWGRFGKEFDPDLLRQKSYIPVTSLARTHLAQQVGGFTYPPNSHYEDWGFYLKMLDAGARFQHVPEITWVWHHHGQNTSGSPFQGDAR